MSLFFALWPDRAVGDTLFERTRKAVQHSGGRAAPRDKLHLTLAFLGDVSTETAQAVIDAADAVPASGAFQLEMGEYGVFRRACILYLAPEHIPGGLRVLETSLWEALSKRGFTRDERAFRPHLTLARKLHRPEVLDQHLDELAVDPVSWRVDGFALVESVAQPSGSRYVVRARWSLA